MTTSGFEYKNKKDETPFETFLRYTDEKVKSAYKLAGILESLLQPQAHVLDIGTGNGEYLALTLANLSNSENIKTTLVEPSEDLVVQLQKRFE